MTLHQVFDSTSASGHPNKPFYLLFFRLKKKMKVLRLPIRYLLVFTVLTGVVNIIMLSDFSKSTYVLRTSRSLGRQIASIEEEFLYPENPSGLVNVGHLEMLNYDLKETLDKYTISMTDTLGQAFLKARAQTTEKSSRKLKIEAANVKCSEKPFLLIQVHSKPENYQSREAIRLSWGSPENTINRGSWIKSDR